MSTTPMVSLDALLPAAMAEKAEQIGTKKARMDFPAMLALSVMAGAFIALGAVFSTTVAAGAAGTLPYGVTRLLAGSAFSLGLILVLVGGAELFTGNNLLIMAWASHRVSTGLLLRNWLIVYVGNFAGAFGTAVLVFLGGNYLFGDGAVGAVALATANVKSGLGFLQAVALGTLCNALVCLAVWLTLSARTTTDKILAIVPPIAAFVAAGFEHCIANMYFIPMGLFIRAGAGDAFWGAIGKTAADYPNVTWERFVVHNLVPVTIGNILGGAVLVGIVYWFIYLRRRHVAPGSLLPTTGHR